MENFLKQQYVVISIMGSHAGESEEEIFERKRREIKNTGKSFWLYKSYSAKPDIVQDLCEEALKEERNTPICIFIQTSSKNGARPTIQADRMQEFSIDQKSWKKIPAGIVVTGSSRNAFIMVFNELELVGDNQYLDLWDYSLFKSPGKAVKMILGASTACCLKKSSKKDSNKMKSNIRKIIAIGKLTYPFASWTR